MQRLRLLVVRWRDDLPHKRLGCPQTAETISVEESNIALINAIAACQEMIVEVTLSYVALTGVEAHRYLVKRPYETYEYNKLTSKQAIFSPQQEENKVKVLHLSCDTDPRNILGRSEIERRNKILYLKMQIEKATKVLTKAMETVEATSIEKVVANKLMR